jgi:uncharacterized membrane protein (UPF0127 family)
MNRARIVNSILAIALFCLTATIVACADGPRVAIVSPDGSRRAIIKVEIANTPGERELGLMYRKHLDENAGMIFLFAHPDHLSFWMKNTEIPLDMIFADQSTKIVGIVENAEPYSETPVGVDGDSLYVLEVNGGFARRHDIRAGDRFRFIGFTPSASQ